MVFGCFWAYWERSWVELRQTDFSFFYDALANLLPFCLGDTRSIGFNHADRESLLYEYIGQKAQFLEVQLHAIGGMPDHIHLIVSIPPKIAIAEFVKRIKGGSSHYLNELSRDKHFAWQREYGVFSLGSPQLDRATRSVNSQKQRHEDRRLIEMLEITSESPDR
jgi:putative transposase